MAQNVKLNFTVTVDDKVEIPSDLYEFARTASGGGNPGKVIIGSGAEEDIDFGDLTGDLFVVIENHDSSNFVSYGAKDTTMKTSHKVNAGMVGIGVKPSAVTWRARADTADVECTIRAWEIT